MAGRPTSRGRGPDVVANGQAAEVRAVAAGTAGFDIPARHNLLPDLVERLIPERTGYGKYDVEITWTPLGRALGQLRSMVPAA
jgi:hypothetical protein